MADLSSFPSLADVYAGQGTNYLNADEARTDTGLNLTHLGQMGARNVHDLQRRYASRGTFYSGGHHTAQTRNAENQVWDAGQMTRQLQNTLNTMDRNRILASLGMSV